jgi:acetyl esterase/lipase
MGATSSILIPDRVDEETCKILIGEANFNQDLFDSKKDPEGFVLRSHLEEAMLADLWNCAPLGARNPDVEEVWDMMVANWALVPGITMPVIEQFRGMVEMLDKNPVELLAQVTMEEVDVNGQKIFVYVPKALEGIEARPAIIYFHGGGFIMSGPEHWKKECAKQAIISNSVVICPTIGVGPEVKAAAWLEYAYAALKWVHVDIHYQIDTSRVCLHGSSHGSYTALELCKSLAEKDEAKLVKFCWLDIPAINNDFVEHAKSPANEPEAMHQACSKLHMQCWATIFADPSEDSQFDWDAMANDATAFPAVMDDALLAKIPPCVLTSGEFDHVGLRGSKLFAERLRGCCVSEDGSGSGKLLGLYIQPGVCHGMYGGAQADRDAAFKRIYSAFL